MDLLFFYKDNIDLCLKKNIFLHEKINEMHVKDTIDIVLVLLFLL